MQLSKNFHLSELVRSQTASRHGLDNTPPQCVINNLRNLTVQILQPVRNHFGVVVVSSGYRSLAVNRKVGSSDGSQHILGLAVDFEVPGVDNLRVRNWIKNNLKYDQLILEYYKPGVKDSGWVHCSCHPVNRNSSFNIG